jgi:hypothetical protein
MTTIKGCTGVGTGPNGARIQPPHSFYPIGFVASGVTRRTPYELPVAVSLHPDGRPPRAVAPDREESCPRTPIHAGFPVLRPAVVATPSLVAPSLTANRPAADRGQAR